MTELDSLKPEVAPAKTGAKIDEKSTPSLRRMTENGALEIEPEDMLSMEATTKKPASADDALEIPVVERADNSKTKPKLVLLPGFVEQLRHKLAPGYTEQSIEVDKVSSS